MEQLAMFFPEEKQRKKRPYRSTSSAAHESIKESKQIMYDKITVGLVKLGIGGTFCEIAFASGLRPEQVWKRLSELQEKGIIYNTGLTKSSTSGRQASIWQLVILKK